MSRVLSPFATIGTKKDKIVVVWLYLLVNVRSFDSIVCFGGGRPCFTDRKKPNYGHPIYCCGSEDELFTQWHRKVDTNLKLIKGRKTFSWV